jgi:hypothetical protein
MTGSYLLDIALMFAAVSLVTVLLTAWTDRL